MIEIQNYVGGQWLPTTGQRRPDINPSDTTDVVALAPMSDADTVDRAVAAARRAQPEWAASSPQQRADLLEAVAVRLLDRADELGRLLALEEGKTWPEARAEVVRAGQIFRFFSGEAWRLAGEYQDSTRAGVVVTSMREPLGVIGVITPWNFPIAIPAWKVAPALAYGNTVVLKPADLVPGCAYALARIVAEVGFPPGVFNVLFGSGSVVGEAMVSHPDLDGLTFTGSEAVGTTIATHLAERLIPVQLELGGKNALVVAGDADLPVAVECAIDGAFKATGQRCTASSRIVVVDEVYDAFVTKFLARMGELRVGHALALETDIGPVVDQTQLETDLSYLELAAATPGAVVHGGERVVHRTPGHYLAPAVIEGLDNTARVNREEIFGPVASVIRVSSYDEAVQVTNDTEYGLAAGICTRSLALAEDFRRRADAGMVMINLPTAGVDPHVAFGGRKRSSYGPKEQGGHARDFFTQWKINYTRP